MNNIEQSDMFVYEDTLYLINKECKAKFISNHMRFYYEYMQLGTFCHNNDNDSYFDILIQYNKNVEPLIICCSKNIIIRDKEIACGDLRKLYTTVTLNEENLNLIKSKTCTLRNIAYQTQYLS